MDVVHGLDSGFALGVGTGLADSTPLTFLTAERFGASVDAYACGTDSDSTTPRMRLWLVSLLGTQQAVKALWAHPVKGGTDTLSTGDGRIHFCALAAEVAPQGSHSSTA